ncbi:ketosteroid isomerase-like protein [Crossiella equi]|uniref:Ketosteroid isomerase-like protein n=1 Tax=Crossiella equi TaxID=130796 RepID=A0ABS5ABY9_9PSEU|nr:nuclear transport factor 2 family protein [Crossiella equi]MBP2474097.1 ketosteroid isomerase-like protein [Crossiella equi]
MPTEIEDRLAIQDLANHYALAVDGKDWAALAGVFTSDARFAAAGVADCQGVEAVVGFVRASCQHLDLTQHHNSNHLVTVAGDDAAHTSYAQAQHVRRGLPGGEKFLVACRYDDRLRRTPDGWRFTSRTVTIVWTEGNPAVLAMPTA